MADADNTHGVDVETRDRIDNMEVDSIEQLTGCFKLKSDAKRAHGAGKSKKGMKMLVFTDGPSRVTWGKFTAADCTGCLQSRVRGDPSPLHELIFAWKGRAIESKEPVGGTGRIALQVEGRPQGKIQLHLQRSDGRTESYSGFRMPTASATCSEKLREACVKEWSSHGSTEQRLDTPAAPVIAPARGAAAERFSVADGSRRLPDEAAGTDWGSIDQIITELQARVQPLVDELETLRRMCRAASSCSCGSMRVELSDDDAGGVSIFASTSSRCVSECSS